MRTLYIVLCFSLSSMCAAHAGQYYGEPFEFIWLKKDYDMKTVNNLGYIDDNKVDWRVPAPFETDGASIPQVFWSVIGGPFEGPYREAAVIHDYYCEHRTHTWQDVHRMFYEASLAAGTSVIKAKIMYAAVYHFGPRWGVGQGSRGPQASLSIVSQKAKLKEYEQLIESTNPPLSAIEAAP